MKKIKLKKISSKLKAEIQKEFNKGFDFSKAKKKGGATKLDEEVLPKPLSITSKKRS
jgi:hypothetical protein